MKDKITAEDMIESLGLLKPKLTLYSIVVSFFKRLKSKYTMTYKRSLFVDTVNGKMVNEYEDCYKNIFMAQSRLGHRVRKKLTTNGGVKTPN